MSNFKLAWRNLWRNRRRTMITSASIFFAVVFALVMRSLQLGSYDHMYKNAIDSYSGYIQVQHPGFWDEKSVDHSFPYTPELDQQVLADENVMATIPRFESFALASGGPQTKGVLVMGVDPEKENSLSKITEKMVKYRLSPESVEKIREDPDLPDQIKELASLFMNSAYSHASRLQLDLGIRESEISQWMPVIRKYTKFENGTIKMGEPGAWLGENLASTLQLEIGDTIVLIGQGYHASTAAGKYEIKGIVKIPLPDIDHRIVYLPLDICQELFNAENNITSLALAVENNKDKAIEATVKRLTDQVSGKQRIIEWREMNEVMVSQMDADNKSGQIMLGILYLVIAFGVFGTVLMLTAERKREFGVLVAIGMQKKKLSSVMTLEMLLIGFMGMMAGVAVGTFVILYGVEHPILFKGETALLFEGYGMEPKMVFWGIGTYYIWQILIVLCMVLAAIGYPIRKIFGLKVVTALRA
ncbi:MAG: FtsX-like permease family protein [Bacteroidales bacterium]